jgi:hypothetical protein
MCYLFLKLQATWIKAQEICCTYKMRLLTLDSKQQMNCLKTLDKDSGTLTEFMKLYMNFFLTYSCAPFFHHIYIYIMNFTLI